GRRPRGARIRSPFSTTLPTVREHHVLPRHLRGLGDLFRPDLHLAGGDHRLRRAVPVHRPRAYRPGRHQRLRKVHTDETAGRCVAPGPWFGDRPRTLGLSTAEHHAQHPTNRRPRPGHRRQAPALRAIESGDASEASLEIFGIDWDVVERAQATLETLGLGGIGLDRTVGELSGGETILLRLAALLIERPDVLLLDEPTNNLDLFARRRLYQAVDTWRSGTLIVISHDMDL